MGTGAQAACTATLPSTFRVARAALKTLDDLVFGLADPEFAAPYRRVRPSDDRKPSAFFFASPLMSVFRLRFAAARAVLGLASLTIVALPAAAQSPILTVQSPVVQEGDRFGSSVSVVPDADGDGQDDLLVGVASVSLNRAYLFSGATGSLLLTLQSPTPFPNGCFGCNVAGVPDANGDGRGDLLVGARSENVSVSGRAYLFSGATGGLLHTFQSPNPEAYGVFGYVVAGVPDTDGDGRGDVAVYADETVGGQFSAGRVYLFSGATGVRLRTHQTPAPGNNGRQFGFALAGVPDANGDGRGDLLLGASTEWGGTPEAGRAYLMSGATGAVLHSLQSPAPESDGLFGASVAGVPDLDGDGRGDLIVGALRETGLASRSGQVHLFSGATGARLHTFQSPNATAEGRFGHDISGVPDTDGDGRYDVLVGVPSEDDGAGRVHLYSSATGAWLRTLQSPNAEAGGAMGASVAGVTTGEGRAAVLTGAPSEDPGVPNAGRVYLFSGTLVALDEQPAGLSVVVGPNPARDVARVSFTLLAAGPVRLTVHDTLGRLVAVVADGARAAGAHDLTVDVSALPAGVYLLRFDGAESSSTRPLTVVR